MELYFMISSFCFKQSTTFLRGKLGRTIVWVIITSLIAINITWYKNYYRGLECKSRKSRNSWSNWQIWPRSTEWSRTKANRVLPRERTGHSKHPLPTTWSHFQAMVYGAGIHCRIQWCSWVEETQIRNWGGLGN